MGVQVVVEPFSASFRGFAIGAEFLDKNFAYIGPTLNALCDMKLKQDLIFLRFSPFTYGSQLFFVLFIIV